MPAFPEPRTPSQKFLKDSIEGVWEWPNAGPATGPVWQVPTGSTVHFRGKVIAYSNYGDPSPDGTRVAVFEVDQTIKSDPTTGAIVNPDDSALPNTIAIGTNDGTFVPTLTLNAGGAAGGSPQSVNFTMGNMTGAPFAMFAIEVFACQTQ